MSDRFSNLNSSLKLRLRFFGKVRPVASNIVCIQIGKGYRHRIDAQTFFQNNNLLISSSLTSKTIYVK